MNSAPRPGRRSQKERDSTAIHPRRHPARIVSSVLVALIGVWLFAAFAFNPNLRWDTVGEYLFDDRILTGVGVTILLTCVAMLMGTVLGVVLAVMRRSPNVIVRGAAGGYIWFFRGTPLLVQLILWYNLAALFPQLSLGIPGGPSFVEVETNQILTGFVAAILGLGLNEGAYMAEVVRSGILGVEKGQFDAADSLSMRRSQVMRFVVLPQAFRIIVPPTGNQFITLFKTTSLVSVIAGSDLLTQAKNIYAHNFMVVELLIVATFWYLLLTTAFTAVQSQVERRLGRGRMEDSGGFGFFQRLAFAGRGTS
ncbi:amino acid ABC transporter permease [Streptomyces sp. SID8352]|uniref:amino acid ABC transporter permease n=1 Tax=Streptomyces sp. SID8352 TaxID=2690338 RepID=UPI001370CFA3|nr:amino acid ABC transporter permease [Streptomyces sp. SID8352]MYU22589.1 ABC transporter permease subunit [Streptomyces sp. SID8352]